MKRAKIAAVKRGSTLRDLVAEALRRLLADQAAPERTSMTDAPVTLQLKSNRLPTRLGVDRWQELFVDTSAGVTGF